MDRMKLKHIRNFWHNYIEGKQNIPTEGSIPKNCVKDVTSF